nr:MAG TPA: N-terminal domain of ribose phosphate pyrophosphokinase [Caudoviricetes sp.]
MAKNKGLKSIILQFLYYPYIRQFCLIGVFLYLWYG